MRPPWLARLGLAFGGVVAAFAFGEVCVRLLPIEEQGFAAGVRAFGQVAVTSDPELGHRLVPGAQVEVDGVAYRVNTLGARGGEPAPATKRVLALGDSVTMGWGVPEEAAWPAKLEELLSAAGRDVSVVNGGVVGYGTREEVVWLEELGPRIKPDVVIVGYYPNDPQPVPPASTSQGSWSKLWRLLESRLRDHSGPTASEHHRALHAPGSDSWARVEVAFADLAAQCERRRWICAVALLPALTATRQPEYALAAVHRQVAKLAEDHRLALLDLASTIADLPDESGWVAPDDPHPDVSVQARYAQAIAAWIERQGWLR